MCRRLSILSALAATAWLVLPPAVASQGVLAGPWAGAVTIMGQKLDIAVTFAGQGPNLKATIDIPQQGAKGVPLTDVRVEGAGVHFELQAGPGTAIFDGERKGDVIAGTFEQAGIKGTFELRPASASAKEPPPPYGVEEVTIAAGPVTLAGTLTLPPGRGPHPVVVLITGSGAQNRDEEIFGMKPFLLIADYLTRTGLAVLRCDDRGVGGSTRGSAEATTADFADDVVAMVQFLKARADIDGKRVGLLGHSEGGLVAPMVATRVPGIAFVVLMSGPAVPGERIMIAQAELLGKASGRSDEQIRKNAEVQRRMFAAVRSGQGWKEVEERALQAVLETLQELPEARRAAVPDLEGTARKAVEQQVAAVRTPWFKYFLDYDPGPALAKVSCPVLAVFGERDLQVPARQNREAMEAIFKASGHRQVTFQVVPRANHLYQDAVTGSAAEYAVLKKEFAPGFLEGLGAWIAQQAGVRPRS